MAAGVVSRLGQPDSADRHGAYQLVLERIVQLVTKHIPPEATVVVVSRGDPELLKLPTRRAWHFPRDEEGRYAGYHPANSEDATAHLEAVRKAGGEYLVLPRTAFWWLEHYTGFRHHLETRYPLAVRDEACLIYRLQESEGALAGGASRDHGAALREDQVRQVVESLLPEQVALLWLAVHDQAPALGSRSVRTLVPPSSGVPHERGGELIADLEALQGGADYLVVPPDAFDWLRAHPDALRHLTGTCRQVVHQQHVCTIFDLRAG